MTRSMGSALKDLALHKLYVVHAGSSRFPLHPRIEALPLEACLAELATLA